MTSPDPTPEIGDILVKGGHRYEYRGGRRMNGADGFLICDLDGTFLDGTAPHWAPDWALPSFELLPAPKRQVRTVPVSRPVVDVHLPEEAERGTAA